MRDALEAVGGQRSARRVETTEVGAAGGERLRRLVAEVGTAHIQAVQRLRDGLDCGGDSEVRQPAAPADVENGELWSRRADEVEEPRLEHRVACERE